MLSTDKRKGSQSQSSKNASPSEKHAPQVMSGSHLLDPFTGGFSYPPVRFGHGQVSPGGQMPREGGQQPFLMGHPFCSHYAGYYGMSQPSLVPIPPYNFTMPSPPAPAVPGQPVEKQSPLSSPIAVKEREATVSPASSPAESQVPTFQPETSRGVAESPKEQKLDELDVSSSSSSSTSSSSTSSPAVKRELD